MARGSIYQYRLKSGEARHEVFYRTSNGVLKKKRGFVNRRDAERYLNRQMEAVDAGRVVSRRETFAAYIDRWLREHRPRIEEGTYLDYRTHVEIRLKPFFGSMRLTDITSADIRRYVAELGDGVG